MNFAALLERSEKGPWILAGWPGECDGCGEEFDAGDEIRADGQGGWEAKRCCDDEDL